MPNLSDIGVRGLVISTDETFFYVTEEDWRHNAEIRQPPTHQGKPVPQELVDLNVAVAKLSKTVFVNLDALANLDDSEVAPPSRRAPSAPSTDALDSGGVLLHEKARWYLVPRKMWKELEDDTEGDAGVLVNRGAIVASIPPNAIPTGTFCVLVNWDGLATRE